MILNSFMIALALITIGASIILFRNTSSKTARVLTLIATLFMLWDAGNVIFNRSDEVSQDNQGGINLEINADDADEVQIDMTRPESSE